MYSETQHLHPRPTVTLGTTTRTKVECSSCLRASTRQRCRTQGACRSGAAGTRELPLAEDTEEPMTSAHIWEEYSHARRPTEDDIEVTERVLGYSLPDDFISLMVDHQGKCAVRTRVRCEDGRKMAIGHLHFLTSNDNGGRNVAQLTSLWRGRGYPRWLVPFATVGSQDHLALDYGETPERPRVSYVFPDGDAVQTGYWSIRPIASSVSDLLGMFETDD
jgi:hypothetical protein